MGYTCPLGAYKLGAYICLVTCVREGLVELLKKVAQLWFCEKRQLKCHSAENSTEYMNDWKDYDSLIKLDTMSKNLMCKGYNDGCR